MKIVILSSCLLIVLIAWIVKEARNAPTIDQNGKMTKNEK